MKLCNIFIFLLLGAVLLSIYIWRQQSYHPISTDVSLVVGTSSDFPPFSTREHDQIVGFDIDVIQEVARRLGKEIELQDMPFETLLTAAQLGSIQLIAAGLSMTPEREQQLFFAQSHYRGDPLVMVSLRENPITDFQQLADKQVLVNEGYVADLYLSARDVPHPLRLKTVADALLALQAHHADVFVTAYSAVKPFFDQQREQLFTYTVIPDTAETYALAIAKQYPQLYQAVNQVIVQMIQDGTIEQYKKKWGLVA